MVMIPRHQLYLKDEIQVAISSITSAARAAASGADPAQPDTNNPAASEAGKYGICIKDGGCGVKPGERALR
jgi:hypothetical protein